MKTRHKLSKTQKKKYVENIGVNCVIDPSAFAVSQMLLIAIEKNRPVRVNTSDSGSIAFEFDNITTLEFQTNQENKVQLFNPYISLESLESVGYL